MTVEETRSAAARHLVPNIAALTKFGIIIAFFVIFAALSFASPYFLTVGNLRNVLLQVSVNGVLAIGMTFVILTAGIDLSVGSVLAFSGMVAASLVTTGSIGSVGLALLLGIGAGALLGAVNGLLIAYLRVPAFVATLGMLSAARGLTRIYSGGRPISSLSPDFLQLGIGHTWGIPVPVIVFVALVALALFVLTQTRFGRHIYAVGGNEKSARVSGIRTRLVILAAYAIAGTCSGIAGILITALNSAAQVQTGTGYELDAIAAVVIGGTSLAGGLGGMTGTIFGILLIGVINNGLDLLGASSDLQPVIKGLVIVFAVLLDIWARGRRP